MEIWRSGDNKLNLVCSAQSLWGKWIFECPLLTMNTMYGDQIWVMPLLTSANQNISVSRVWLLGIAKHRKVNLWPRITHEGSKLGGAGQALSSNKARFLTAQLVQETWRCGHWQLSGCDCIVVVEFVHTTPMLSYTLVYSQLRAPSLSI